MWRLLKIPWMEGHLNIDRGTSIRKNAQLALLNKKMTLLCY